MYDKIFGSGRVEPANPRTQNMILFVFYFLLEVLCSVFKDELVMKTAISMLGDLADTLGSNVGSLSQQSLSSKYILNECLSSEDHLIKEAAEWAKQAIIRYFYLSVLLLLNFSFFSFFSVKIIKEWNVKTGESCRTEMFVLNLRINVGAYRLDQVLINS
ncbi:putative armadillo-like helical, importin beta family [Helianthus debilis subsp. tardiflorus]